MSSEAKTPQPKDLPPLPEPLSVPADQIVQQISTDAEAEMKADSTTPDPGEGWRIVGHDEPIQEGDEHDGDSGGKVWYESCGVPSSRRLSSVYRRRVPVDPPTPATRTIVFHEVVIRDAYQDRLCFVSEVNTDCHIPTGRTETREVPR
jgi:hypothetical protein